MKNNIKKVIYNILAVILILIFTMFCKYYITQKSQNNANLDENIKSNNYNSIQIELTPAIVTKIIDGDTILVDIDGESKKVRLIGIDCPEYTTEIEAFGKEATDFTSQNLLGKTVYLQKDISDTDSYDRLLRYVWIQKIDVINKENINNYLFNNILVTQGLAQSNYYKPDILLQHYLESSESYAKKQKIGMWQ